MAVLLVAALVGWFSSRRTAPKAIPASVRASTGDVMGAIDAFWQWWQSAKEPLAAAIANRTLDSWVEPISEHVRAIDAGLEWELGPGVKSQHHICVSAAGDAVLRVTAE